MITARHRRDKLGQKVIILDPFGVLAMHGCVDLPLSRYNPLEWIERIDREFVDEVALLADALVIKEKRDVHFSESARVLLKAIMLGLLCGGFGDAAHDLTSVRQLAMQGENGAGINTLIAKLVGMQDNGGAIARSASMLYHMGDRELGGVISTMGRNTEFLDSPSMRDVLTGKSSFDPRTIKTEPTTIYFVLPEWRLNSHGRWLRLMIVSLLSHLQRGPAAPEMPHTALILDEFASLGYMEPIERAVSYVAGFGVKSISVVQDLNQLAALYEQRWQTFVANAGVVMAFSNADNLTAEFLSKRCGETEVLRLEHNTQDSASRGDTHAGLSARLQAALKGDGLAQLGAQSTQSGGTRSTSTTPRRVSTALLTPDEVMVHFARETGSMLVLINGARPMILRRIRYYDDPLFRDLASENPLHPYTRNSDETGGSNSR